MLIIVMQRIIIWQLLVQRSLESEMFNVKIRHLKMIY
jgi:hypothetical protein